MITHKTDKGKNKNKKKTFVPVYRKKLQNKPLPHDFFFLFVNPSLFVVEVQLLSPNASILSGGGLKRSKKFKHSL